jgi:glutamine synthetase
MKELDEELWKLGVYAKTKHNETAPAQHELTPIFTTTNIAVDHNQLTMELMKSIADKHGLACLLHEKPFAGVNGSGKHNNWSISTDTGINLLEPGETPYENAQFLLFVVAVIKGLDEYQDLFRCAAASAGNDHRLGANEAPPAIVSMFLGDELTEILEAIESGTDYIGKKKNPMTLGVTVLPHFPRDTTDRNRTSPFAFTGNKFEFRMLGSAFSVAGPNVVLNTAVAEGLRRFANVLEKSNDFTGDLVALVKATFRKHKRIIFNGNSYSEEWRAEAQQRGLLDLKTAVDAFPAFIDPKNIALYGKHNVFSELELRSRFEIFTTAYCKTIHIEALTMADMVKKIVIPACIDYQNDLAELLERKKTLNRGPDASRGFDCLLEEGLLQRIASLCAEMFVKLRILEERITETDQPRELYDDACFYRDKICTAMSELRIIVDELETLIAKKYFTMPIYAELLYSVV